MALIFRFRRLVFAQVLLGIVAFCIAEPNPGMLLVAGAVAAMSWYVTEGPSGRPLPRWTINLGAIAAVAWLLLDLKWQSGHVIIAMGHFVMWMQILLLYTEKSNREYGQLLILSIMQMIGASVLSVSMIYGILLAGYCVLALLTVLMFQLKGVSDSVYEANRAAAPKRFAVGRPKPVFCRGHRWHFRFMAVTVGLICGAIAVAVFVITPRSSESRLPGHGEKGSTVSKTGFRNQVQLNTSPPKEGSKEPVLNMRVMLNGVNLGSNDRAWLLRGAALDTYLRESHTWVRSNVSGHDHYIKLNESSAQLADMPEFGPMFEATITLRQQGQRSLFTLHPIVSFTSDNLSEVQFNPLDQKVSADSALGAVIYSFKSPVTPPPDLVDQYFKSLPKDEKNQSKASQAKKTEEYARGWRVQPKRITSFTQEILRKNGLSRDPEVEYDPNDVQIVRALVNHLQNNYQYSLENPPTAKGDEPLVEFLFNRREGHCELFASALAAMARSIGIPARVVTGYRVSEYNGIGGYYVVRQSNAHAWTEIDCGPNFGWRTFDATPPADVRAEHHVDRNWLTVVREIYEHLEFAWIRSVVAFDNRTREEVIADIRSSVSKAADERSSWVGSVVLFFRELPDTWRLNRVNYSLVGIIIVLIGIGVGSLVRTALLRRKRMVALQLTALPRTKRRGLARRLKFYLKMLDMLERHGYVRPEWQSPFSFAQDLAQANPGRFDPVIALTEIFYEIRFGHRQVDDDRKEQIRANLKSLEESLATRNN